MPNTGSTHPVCPHLTHSGTASEFRNYEYRGNENEFLCKFTAKFDAHLTTFHTNAPISRAVWELSGSNFTVVLQTRDEQDEPILVNYGQIQTPSFASTSSHFSNMPKIRKSLPNPLRPPPYLATYLFNRAQTLPRR